MLKLDAHVAGVDPSILKLNAKGHQELTARLDDLMSNRFSKLLVADSGPGTKLLAMGDIALWHVDDMWKNPERKGISYAVIDDLWVEPEARQFGISKAIVRDLVTFASENSIDDLILEYATTNIEAEATWSRLGFKTTGVRAAAPVADVLNRLATSEQIPEHEDD